MALYLFACCCMITLSLSIGKASCQSRDATECNDTLVTNQLQLDKFVETLRSYENGANKCIHLSLAGNGSFTLDIVDFMNTTSFTMGINGSLVVQAVDSMVDINCVAGQSDLDGLLAILRPISNIRSVVFQGLVFMSCPVPVLIEEVAMVMVKNCVFLHHEHGALNIFNSPNVVVGNCTFHNNTSNGFFTRRSFQGNAGALSIAYNTRFSNRTVSSVSVLVTDCTFTNNRALLSTVLSSTEVIAMNVFPGRGAAIAMPINISSPVNYVVKDNVFINNSAAGLGGCIYCFIGGPYINQTFFIVNNMFIDNRARVAGVMTFVTGQRIPETYFLRNTIQNCTFIRNSAAICGCINHYQHLGFAGDLIKFVDCKFYNNSALLYAGAIDIISYRLFGSRQHQQPIHLTNCVFDGNIAPSAAAFNLAYFDARLDNVSLTNHRGSALRVIAGKITLHGLVKFYNNDADNDYSGALHLISLSQMNVESGTHLDFVNNTGRFGAAIVTTFGFSSTIFYQSYFNPLCFFQYFVSSTPPSRWDKVSMNFAGNQALIGSSIYANGLDLCSWFAYSPPYFNHTDEVFRWSLITYSDDNYNSGHSVQNSLNRSLAVQTPPVVFIIQDKFIKAYPGQSLNMSIFSYDEQNFTTSDTVQFKGSSSNIDVSFVFSPSAKALLPSELRFPVRFSIQTSKEIIGSIFNQTYLINVSAPRSQSQSEEEHFELLVTTCPPGHALLSVDVNNEYECRCDDINDQNIVRCLPDEGRVILKDGYWAHDASFGSVDGTLEYYWCPPGYCRCSRDGNMCNSIYYYDENDLQCVCDRKGYLCGDCRGDKGVSVLLNRCVSCGHASLLLLVALVIIDVIVVTAILLSSITLLPWLYPFLFYIQVTPYIAEYFPLTFRAAHPYLYYISSAASLYFPYDFCLYPGMTALVSYSLRYIPILLSLAIFSIIYIVYSKFKTTLNLRVLWSGLWLLILLQFTNVMSTSISILNCPLLKDFDGRSSLRWYVDGTVECFTGGHAALAAFAVLTLIVCIVLIAVVTVIVLGIVERPSLQRTLQEPYTDNSKWIAPVELVRRLLVVVFIIIKPGNLAPVLLLIMLCVAVYGFVQPYKRFYVNVLETMTLVDVLLMLIIASTTAFEDVVFHRSNSFNIDRCGNVDTISKYSAILIPFYYFPLIILVALIARKIGLRILKSRFFRKRSRQLVVVAADQAGGLNTSYSFYSEPCKTTEINIFKPK